MASFMSPKKNLTRTRRPKGLNVGIDENNGQLGGQSVRGPNSPMRKTSAKSSLLNSPMRRQQQDIDSPLRRLDNNYDAIEDTFMSPKVDRRKQGQRR